MARLPFDPDKLSGPPPARQARRERARAAEPATDGQAKAGPRPLGVSEAAALIKRTLADHTPAPLRVVGEVSNFNERGHWFFSLKDDEAVLSCVMWRSAAAKVGFTPQRGQQVVATGRLDFYGPQGKVQLYADRLEPVGQGALELRFRQLCDELRQAGYFDEAHKRALPQFPRHIAVVTSAAGAAVQDVIRTAHHRWPGCRLSIVNVRVQGASAAPEVAAAIEALSEGHRRHGIDAVIVTRGGGSLEDLWAFNERIVAEAIYCARVPIVAAIGHEVDTTIAELVADLRCSTPTQAAERLVPDGRAERQRIDALQHRLATALRRRAEGARATLRGIERHELFRQPRAIVDLQRRRLNEATQRLRTAARTAVGEARGRLHEAERLIARFEPRGRLRFARQALATAEQRLDRAMRERRAGAKRGVDERAARLGGALQRRHEQAAQRLDALHRQLEAVGPNSVLRRGYSYTTDSRGDLVRSVNQLAPGDRIDTHLADGKVPSRVEADDAAPPSPAPPPKPGPASRPKRRAKRPPREEGQEELFG